jgi:hypothetical protein
MNIFILDSDPVKAAQYLCDKHIVKMCLETAQILSTISNGPYKPTHANHPCTIWARETLGNYRWLVVHGIAIGQEYEYRYGKEHKSLDIIKSCISYRPNDSTVITPFALAMPQEYRKEDAVESYRDYYMSKRAFCDWTEREVPEWYLERLDALG